MTDSEMDFIRAQFPALAGDWIFFDNAGGSQTARQVVERMQDYLYNTNVQLGASYDISKRAGERVNEAQKNLAEFIHAKDPAEVILGSSTTQLLHNLSKSMVQSFRPGDEVIVTNCDHEANIGPWISMERAGIKVKFWNINPETFKLDLDQLERLMTDKTRLVAFTHVSNILGTINPVKEITSFVHEHGALVCVDGVACAPHRKIDVQGWDVDFYAFSFYKVYGPHYSLLYAKREHLLKLPGINHFFIGESDIPYKLQPGNVNYELTYGLLGVLDYFKAVQRNILNNNSNDFFGLFQHFAKHEESLALMVLEFLAGKKGVKVYGHATSNKDKRVPTVSFTVAGHKSSSIPIETDKHRIGIRFGDFYARRLIDYLGLSQKDGVVRISLVHYNTKAEVEKLLEVLDKIL